jgi:hypothetical protein
VSETQVVTFDVNGGNPRWLGAIGHVSQLVYSSSYPGGCDQMSCVLQQPPDFRSDCMDPGRIVQCYRGAQRIFDGKLDEPQPSASGWAITAHGSGVAGTDFLAVYGSYTPNDVITNGIGRGLRWATPSISTTGLYLAQPAASGSQTITDFMNAVTALGGFAWQVARIDNSVTVEPLPSTPTRILVATTPVARTIVADINAIGVQYTASDDSAGNQTFGQVWATNAASIAKHGRMEAFADLSSAGVMTSAEAITLGNLLLAKYQRANYAGPFTCLPGQILNPGGQPVDLGMEQAGEVYRLVVTDGSYGGEVTPGPVTFIGGQVEYDDGSGALTVTPFASITSDLGSLVGALVAAITPR